MIPTVPRHVLLDVVRRALAEDLGGRGDLTGQATLPADLEGAYTVRARARGRLAGSHAARLAFPEIDPSLRLEGWLDDGAELEPGTVIGRIAGPVRAILAAGWRSGFGDEWIRLVGVEWCPDCSTSGRTAAYYTPYLGEKALGEPNDNRGMLLYEQEDFDARVLEAHRAGLTVCADGVGDRGIDFVLDAFEKALAACPRPDHRMRVEHCCYVTPPLQERLKKLGVIDSSATGFMYDLGDAYIANRGQEAMARMWPHRAMIDAGIPAPGHSDAMVCQANPFLALWSMVNRKSDTGGDLDASQAITPTEALNAYTWLGAHSGREEHLKGSLEIGKLADVAVLDRDYFSIPTEEIREVQVDMTVIGGRVVHQR